MRGSVRLEVDTPEAWSRWLALVRPALWLPHVLIGLVLTPLAVATYVLSGAAVLVTGRYPAPARRLVVGLGRWLSRALAYAWMLVDDYPPLLPGPAPGYPVRLAVEPPPGDRVERWRPLAAWLLVLPHTVFLLLLYVGLLMLSPAVIVSIAAGRGYPEGLRLLVTDTLAFQARLTGYVFFVAGERPGYALGT